MTDDTHDQTYEIVRVYQDDTVPRETIRAGLTLDEAIEHTNDPQTSSATATTREAVEVTRKHGEWIDVRYPEES